MITTQQLAARMAHFWALENYRNAASGERDRTRKALHDAATEILIADNQANAGVRLAKGAV